jgi:Ca2+-binding EF-hand superfamily protein
MDTPRKILEELRQVFTKIGGKDKLIDRSEFKKAMGLKDEYFAERMFAMFDNDKSGVIDLEKFLKTVE